MSNASTPLIAASLLAADFADIAGSLQRIEQAGTDWIHLDVMDGAFVPNLTFGPKMVADVRKRTSLPLDVHLMMRQPESFIEQFADAGADYLTFHLEAAVHAHRLVSQIKECGVRAGISIVPSTPASALSELLNIVDLILVMTVNPGFGGQTLIPECLDKIRLYAEWRGGRDRSYLIEVDGGINRETVAEVRKAGADVLVSGSALFSSPEPEKEIDFFRGPKQQR